MWWGFAFSNAMNIDADDFTLLGLRRAFALDRGQLDAAWKALQAQVHPDRFAAEGGTAQRLAMQWAVRVNEAYACLKDPLSRAAYLCELRGVAIDAERNTAMPAAFLMQQMAWREALDEAADAGAVERLDAEVAAHIGEVLWVQGRHDEARKYFDEARGIVIDLNTGLATLCVGAGMGIATIIERI